MKSHKQIARAHASVQIPRAALYLRVSTGRQAEHDVSIPDQRQKLQSWCRGHGYAVATEFVEAGASATDDRRAVFQQMIERACDGENAFDVIVVHSYSRFFREAFEQEFYLRKLAKHNVRVVSITQPVGDENEPVHAMMRKVIALFDEYQSRENAKHVIRSMKENARQGFWNGSTVPLGYRSRSRKAGNQDQEEARCRSGRGRIHPADLQALSLRRRQIGSPRRQGSGQMAQPQRLPDPPWAEFWRFCRAQDPDQHDLYRSVQVQCDLISYPTTQAGCRSGKDRRPGHRRAAPVRADTGSAAGA